MTELKLSIVIPLYNTPVDYFGSCLESIREQTLPKNFAEVIIVDDCSTVDYSKIYEEYSDLPLRIERLEQNLGPGVARHKGVDLAKGRYITFLDADDEFFDSVSIKNLYEAALKNPFHDMVCGKVLEQLENGEVYPHLDDYVWCFAKLFKRDFLKKNEINFNNTRANEDNSFCTLCSLVSKKIIWIDDFVYFWKYQPNSITRRNNQSYKYSEFKSYVENMIWVYDELVKRKKEKEKSSLQFYANVWIRLYFHLLTSCKKDIKWGLETLQLARLYYEKIYQFYKNNCDRYFSNCYEQMFYSSTVDFVSPPLVSFVEFEYRIENNKITELDYLKYKER